MIHPWVLLALPVAIFVSSAVILALGRMLQRADDHWWVVPLFFSVLLPFVLLAFATSILILVLALVPSGSP